MTYIMYSKWKSYNQNNNTHTQLIIYMYNPSLLNNYILNFINLFIEYSYTNTKQNKNIHIALKEKLIIHNEPSSVYRCWQSCILTNSQLNNRVTWQVSLWTKNKSQAFFSLIGFSIQSLWKCMLTFYNKKYILNNNNNYYILVTITNFNYINQTNNSKWAQL